MTKGKIFVTQFPRSKQTGKEITLEQMKISSYYKINHKLKVFMGDRVLRAGALG